MVKKKIATKRPPKTYPPPPPLPPDTAERLERLLTSAEWTFARTDVQNPHHYTQRRTWPDDAAFVWTCDQINHYGRREKFNGSWWTVLHLNGCIYWTGWWRCERTLWINRKPIEA